MLLVLDNGIAHGVRSQGRGAGRIGQERAATEEGTGRRRRCNMKSKSKDPWSATFPVVLGIIGLIVLVGGFGTWSVMSQISGAIVASGRIEVDRNRQVVQHAVGGGGGRDRGR